MDFFKSQFDKLLLAAAFLALVVLYFHAMHHGADTGSLTWLQQNAGNVLAAILTLCGAQALRRSGGGTDGATK